MARKLLFDLRVKSIGGAVRLFFGKATPAYLADPDDRSPLGIRIYRKEEPAFVFGRDYMEYFDGIGADGAEVIFEGRLPAFDARMYAYTDETVQTGRTYAYWVSADREEVPTGPVPVRVRDPEIWWPHDKVVRFMERLAADEARLVAVRSFGRTVRGRPIQGMLVGNRSRCVALVGLVHAGEAGPELILPAVRRLLGEHRELLAEAGLAIVPSVNIDMRERQAEGDPVYLRTNESGVDINRNFPARWEMVERDYGQDTRNPHVSTYRGEAPGSEPETKALMHFIDQVSPLGVFTFHSLASICGDAFLTSRFAAEDEAYADSCLRLVKPYSHGFARGEAYRLKLRHECTAGSFPSWLYLNGGVPAFDLEWDGRPQSRAALVDGTTRELLGEYQDRHYRGLVEVLQTVARAGKGAEEA